MATVHKRRQQEEAPLRSAQGQPGPGSHPEATGAMLTATAGRGINGNTGKETGRGHHGKAGRGAPRCSEVYTLARELSEHHIHRELDKFLTAERNELDVDEVDAQGRTLLIHAACAGAHKCAQVLLEFGSRVDHADANGDTALHCAFQHKHVAVAALLIRHGAAETLRNGHGHVARDVCAGDKFKKQIFYWHVCQGLDEARHFPKPVPEDFKEPRRGGEGGGGEHKLRDGHTFPQHRHWHQASIAEMLERYKPRTLADGAGDSTDGGRESRRGRKGRAAGKTAGNRFQSPRQQTHVRGASAGARLQESGPGTAAASSAVGRPLSPTSTRALKKNAALMQQQRKQMGVAPLARAPASGHRRANSKERKPRRRSSTKGRSGAGASGVGSGSDDDMKNLSQHMALEILIEDRDHQNHRRSASSMSPQRLQRLPVANQHQRAKSDRFMWLRPAAAAAPSGGSGGGKGSRAARDGAVGVRSDGGGAGRADGGGGGGGGNSHGRWRLRAVDDGLRLHSPATSPKRASSPTSPKTSRWGELQQEHSGTEPTQQHEQQPPPHKQRPASPPRLRPLSPSSHNNVDLGGRTGGHARSKTAVVVSLRPARAGSARRTQSMAVALSPRSTQAAEREAAEQQRQRSPSPGPAPLPQLVGGQSPQKALGGGGANVRPQFWTPHSAAHTHTESVPGHSGGNVLSWLHRFQHEQGLFDSRHVFAQVKLDEARQMLAAGDDLAPRALTSLLGFLLADLEVDLASRGAGAGPFTAMYVVFSVFHHPEGDRRLPTRHLVPAAQCMMGIASPVPEHTLLAESGGGGAGAGGDSGGGDGAPPLTRLGVALETVSECNSEHELVLFLRRRFEEEMVLRPRLEAALRAARRLKLLEQKTVNRMTVRSMLGLRRRVLHKWRMAVIARRRLNAIGMQLFGNHRSAMLKTYIKHWRFVVTDAHLKRQQQRALELRNAIRRATQLKEQAARRIREVTNSLQELQDALEDLTTRYEEKQALLRNPTRNPKTLGHITMILADALTACCTTITAAASFQRRNVCDAQRLDRGTVEVFLGLQEDPCGAGQGKGQGQAQPQQQHPQPQQPPPWDPAMEEAMLRFQAGARGVDEWTPAFEPFKRRCGHQLLRWVEYQNRFVGELDPAVYVDHEAREREVKRQSDRRLLAAAACIAKDGSRTDGVTVAEPTVAEGAAAAAEAQRRADEAAKADAALLARTFDRFDAAAAVEAKTGALQGARSLKSVTALANLCAVLQTQRDPRMALFTPKREPEERIARVQLQELEEEDAESSSSEEDPEVACAGEDEDTTDSEDGDDDDDSEMGLSSSRTGGARTSRRHSRTASLHSPRQGTSRRGSGNTARDAPAAAGEDDGKVAARDGAAVNGGGGVANGGDGGGGGSKQDRGSAVPALALDMVGAVASSTLVRRKRERQRSARRADRSARREWAAGERERARARARRLLARYKESGFLQDGFLEFVTAEHLALRHPKKSRAQRLMERRMRRRLEEESTTDIVVQLVSKYFTYRVSVPKKGPQYLFAFVAFLFTTSPCVRRDLAALGKRLGGLEEAFREPLKETAARVATFNKMRLPVDHEKTELLAVAADVTAARRHLAEPNGAFVGEVTRVYADAARFDALLDHAVFVCWQSVCVRVLSRRFREEIDVDDGTFTRLYAPKLQPVFVELGLSDEDGAAQMAATTKVYKQRIRDLKRIFGYYAASKPGDVGTMDKAEYWKFIKEIKVQADSSKHRILSSRVDLIFQMYCLLAFKLLEDADKVFSAELAPSDFVHVLVYLACYAFPKTSKVPLSERVGVLLEQHVLPNACSADIDVFRDRFYLEETQDELEAHKFNIYGLYEFYAAADQSDEAALSLDTMNMKEFTAFANDAGVVGPGRLSYIAVRTVFAYVQQDMDIMETSFASNATAAEIPDDEDDDGNEMVLREFMESLAATAVWIDPNPLKTVASRLRTALEKVMVPNAMEKSQIEAFMRKYKLPKHAQ